MKELMQKFYNHDGSYSHTVTHLYSETGHFERDGQYAGTHIEIGTGDTADHYTSVSDGVHHEIPDSLPDITLPEPIEPDEEATEEDYIAALEEMGVAVNEEG